MIIAAAAIVPWTICTNSGAEDNVEQMMPVNTKDKPECGKSVKPRYLPDPRTVIIQLIENIYLNKKIFWKI